MINPESLIFTLILEARSSQNLEEDTMTVGPISLKSSTTVSKVSGKFMDRPPESVIPIPHTWSTIHAVGVMEIQLSPMPMGAVSSHFRDISVKFS